MGSLALTIPSIGLGGFILERTRGKPETRLVKVLAALGMLFGVLGYIKVIELQPAPRCRKMVRIWQL
jgi:hypothetical protein